MYRANKDSYFFNNKASVLFIEEIYTPRNDAEVELLELMSKQGKVGKVGVVRQEPINEVKEDKKEVGFQTDDFELLKTMYFDKYQKNIPNNKKNDLEWIKSKL